MSVSKEFARYILNVHFENLPQEVIGAAKRCVLDWLGSAIAGANQSPIQIIRQVAEEMGGAAQATKVTGGQSSVALAALVNGASSHIVELDDIHKASIIHAGTVVIPAALAMAEWKARSGKELIEAVVAGYEVCYRVGEAVSPSHYYHWHNTATCGTFGAAAAAAKLLDLGDEQIVHALGNAGTQAAGLWEFIVDGSMSKQLHPGKAAMNGILAALLAEKGFTGASRILEGDRGFIKAMSAEDKPHCLTEGLGAVYKIMENSFKIHASCRHTHHAIDLVLELSAQNRLQPVDVESIRVKTYQVALNITDNSKPDSVYAAKFSLQFCTALALVRKRAGLSDFTEETLYDSKIRELMKRVEVVVEPEIDAHYPETWGATVEIVKTDGSILHKHAEYPKGDPENPVSESEIVAKFRYLAAHLPPETVERFVRTVGELEHLGDVREFFPAGEGAK
ncbi:MmgE/PrpD family protein [Brevibacillus sp. NRS-1366]|uniref:MmgE/PrpD family protein n=1 Tax=Brevibacillus sp. NRS-1366 TaxID=3233899 RepID=UPI003D261017